MADSLEVDLVAADGKVWSGSARQVSAPAAEGEIGILLGHTPILSVLRAGEVRVRTTDGETLSWQVDGGFFSVDDDRVVVVVDALSDSTAAQAH